MPEDRKPPTDVQLSEADVKRVLERAARIDDGRSRVSVSDLTQAAHEAGISEQAVIQAVRELLDARQVTTSDDISITPQAASSIRVWPRAVAFGVLLVIGLMLLWALMRIVVVT
jgi:hypothetical protein